MAKPGPVGGAATLSSFRVQKAFSINFRENKRLVTRIKFIENEHIRNIRHVKQEIKETRIWMDAIRESTGESQHGLRPDTEPSQNGRRRKRKIIKRSKTVEPPEPEIQLMVLDSDVSGGEDNDLTKFSEQDKISHVKFKSKKEDNKTISPVRPWTEMSAKNMTKDNNANRSDLKSEPAPPAGNSKLLPSTYNEPEKSDAEKSRVQSANSGQSSLASLTVYQRRHKLQSMMMKKQNPLEYKRTMVRRDARRVNDKVADYLNNLEERMNITMSDLSQWQDDEERHNTSIPNDVDVTS